MQSLLGDEDRQPLDLCVIEHPGPGRHPG
jgi:hypothetical protein